MVGVVDGVEDPAKAFADVEIEIEVVSPSWRH